VSFLNWQFFSRLANAIPQILNKVKTFRNGKLRELAHRWVHVYLQARSIGGEARSSSSVPRKTTLYNPIFYQRRHRLHYPRRSLFSGAIRCWKPTWPPMSLLV
jgi:hypothetical protein